MAATTSETVAPRRSKSSADLAPLPRVSLLDMFQNKAPNSVSADAPTSTWSVLADDFVRQDGTGDGDPSQNGAADLLDDSDG